MRAAWSAGRFGATRLAFAAVFLDVIPKGILGVQLRSARNSKCCPQYDPVLLGFAIIICTLPLIHLSDGPRHCMGQLGTEESADLGFIIDQWRWKHSRYGTGLLRQPK